MMRSPWVFIFVVILCAPGCASTRNKKEIKNLKSEVSSLKVQLSASSNKFELAKKENLNLRRQITLFKKYQDIDTQHFVKALELFEKELSDEIAANDVWVQLADRGLVITVCAEKLFATATATLSDEGKAFLDKVSGLIDLTFPYNYVFIEGHTDNQSLAIFEWKSDWDFSFARSLGVVKYFTEKKHMDPLRFSASGFGQYRPRASNETKEGRRLNRRIEIVVSPQRLKHSVSP